MPAIVAPEGFAPVLSFAGVAALCSGMRRNVEVSPMTAMVTVTRTTMHPTLTAVSLAGCANISGSKTIHKTRPRRSPACTNSHPKLEAWAGVARPAAA